MTAERGIKIDHSTINRWVLIHAPQLEKDFHKKKKQPGNSWRLDETYIKKKVSGNTIIVLLTRRVIQLILSLQPSGILRRPNVFL